MTSESKANAKRTKRPWTIGEKALLWAIIGTLALVGLGALWVERNSAPPSVFIPTPTMPPQNAFDYFNAAANAEVQARAMGWAEMGPPPKGATGAGSWPQLTLAQKAALIQANAPMLRLLRQGLALPYQAPPIRSYSTTMPYYAHFRETARVLGVAGRVQEAQGNWGGAVSTQLDAIQYGEKMTHGGPLIGLLVGIACEAIGRWSLWDAVNHLNAAQAESAARRLEAIQAERAPYVATVQEEKWVGQAGLLEILRRPDWRAQLIQASDLYTGNGTGSNAVNNAAITVNTMFLSPRQVFSDYTQYMDKQIQLAQQPYAARAGSAPASGDFFVQGLTIDYSPAREKAAYTEAEDSLLTVALALWAYDWDHHTYPASLSTLVPKYLPTVPNDPFAPSEPLRYKLAGKKYVLYSVGPDGKDDGGKPIFDASKPAPVPGAHDQRTIVQADSVGDIVAGVNR